MKWLRRGIHSLLQENEHALSIDKAAFITYGVRLPPIPRTKDIDGFRQILAEIERQERIAVTPPSKEEPKKK